MSIHSQFQLTATPLGHTVRIRQLKSQQPGVCSRLRELGFCENAIIRCINKGSGSIICEVCNTRIGLNATVASTIFVTPLEHS